MGTSKLMAPQSELQETELSMGTMDCLGNKYELPRGECVKCHRQTPLLWHQLQCRRTTGFKIDLKTGLRLKITCLILQHFSAFQNTEKNDFIFQPSLKCNYFFFLLGISLFKDNTSKNVPMGKLHLGYYYFHYLLTSDCFGWPGL